MSKRHAASRRRSYGRRQHEVAERRDRDLAPERMDVAPDELGLETALDGLVLGDRRAARLYFATGS
jgi:hypothetical protein